MTQETNSTADEGVQAASRRKIRAEMLSAAKELVAIKGPRATTIRDISLATGTNMAAVNYYYGSKERLLDAATVEIIHDVNQERLRLLAEFEQQQAGAPLTPRQLLEALIAAILNVSRAEDGGSLYLRLLVQLRTVPHALDNRRSFTLYHHVADRFIGSIMATFGTLDREAAVWHYEYARGTALHMLANLDPVSRRIDLLIHGVRALEETPPTPLDLDAVNRIIEMLLHGFGHPGLARARD